MLTKISFPVSAFSTGNLFLPHENKIFCYLYNINWDRHEKQVIVAYNSDEA